MRKKAASKRNSLFKRRKKKVLFFQQVANFGQQNFLFGRCGRRSRRLFFLPFSCIDDIYEHKHDKSNKQKSNDSSNKTTIKNSHFWRGDSAGGVCFACFYYVFHFVKSSTAGQLTDHRGDDSFGKSTGNFSES